MQNSNPETSAPPKPNRMDTITKSDPTQSDHLPHEGSETSYPSSPTARDPVLLRDAIIGFSDGLTVPFALTAGLSSLGDSRLVILGGLAELFAGAISMGLGVILASITERKRYEIVKAKEMEKLQGDVERKAQASMTEIDPEPISSTATLEKKLQVTEQVGEDGAKIPNDRRPEKEIRRIFYDYGLRTRDTGGIAKRLAADEALWVKFVMNFKLRLEKPERGFALLEGLVMSVAYFIGGLIPMIPYFVIRRTLTALWVSVAMTAVTLILFGYVKAVITGCKSRDRWISAAQTLAVGVVATGASYGVVRGINAVSPPGHEACEKKPA